MMNHKKTIFIILSLIFFIDAAVYLQDLISTNASVSGLALFMVVANAVGVVILGYGAMTME
jgi:hypothetical protein